MALSAGCPWAAARHCSAAKAESPTMPTFPSHQLWLGDPLDGVVVVPLIADAEVALRLVAAAHLADHMNVAVGDKTLGVAALDHPVPLRRPGRLPDLEVLGHLHPLQVLVVHGAGVEDGELPGRIGAVDVDAQRDTVAHRDG